MHSHGGDEKRDTWLGFVLWSVAAAAVIALSIGLALLLVSYTTTNEFLRPRLIEREPNYGDYVLFLKSEKRADCKAPYFVLIGKVSKHQPIEAISVMRMTQLLRNPDVSATMNGNEFRIVGPPILAGHTDTFELKVTLAPTGEQVVIGRVIDTPGDCPAK